MRPAYGCSEATHAIYCCNLERNSPSLAVALNWGIGSQFFECAREVCCDITIAKLPNVLYDFHTGFGPSHGRQNLPPQLAC
jgi:hypothetical protein